MASWQPTVDSQQSTAIRQRRLQFSGGQLKAEFRVQDSKSKILILQLTGWEFPREVGTALVHRIPPVGLKCLSDRRRKEMAALVGGDQGSGRRA